MLINLSKGAFVRGEFYTKLGVIGKARRDYKKACEYGYEEACDVLKAYYGH